MLALVSGRHDFDPYFRRSIGSIRSDRRFDPGNEGLDYKVGFFLFFIS